MVLLSHWVNAALSSRKYSWKKLIVFFSVRIFIFIIVTYIVYYFINTIWHSAIRLQFSHRYRRRNYSFVLFFFFGTLESIITSYAFAYTFHIYSTAYNDTKVFQVWNGEAKSVREMQRILHTIWLCYSTLHTLELIDINKLQCHCLLLLLLLHWIEIV